jgi:hypothetical protein
MDEKERLNVRQRIIAAWVAKSRASFDEAWTHIGKNPPLRTSQWAATATIVAETEAAKFADAVMARRELHGREPELAVKLQWLVAKHVHDPADWDDISTVVDLLDLLAEEKHGCK